jgi:hypothetical protein
MVQIKLSELGTFVELIALYPREVTAPNVTNPTKSSKDKENCTNPTSRSFLLFPGVSNFNKSKRYE